jgi:hypothetical protein
MNNCDVRCADWLWDEPNKRVRKDWYISAKIQSWEADTTFPSWKSMTKCLYRGNKCSESSRGSWFSYGLKAFSLFASPISSVVESHFVKVRIKIKLTRRRLQARTWCRELFINRDSAHLFRRFVMVPTRVNILCIPKLVLLLDSWRTSSRTLSASRRTDGKSSPSLRTRRTRVPRADLA